jgi:putative DNA primase/helicase
MIETENKVNTNEIFNIPSPINSDNIIEENKKKSTNELLDKMLELVEVTIEQEQELVHEKTIKQDILFAEGRKANRDEIAILNNRPLTDMGNAERLIDQFKPYIRYCHQNEMWYIWNSIEGRWKIDENERIIQISKEVTRRIFHEASRLPINQAKITQWGLLCECKTHQRGMIELARTDPLVQIRLDDLDKDDYIINMGNGTFDLKTYTLRDHVKGDYISKTVGYDYDPKATCPLWLKFLDRVFKSRQDKDEIISFIQHAVGYSLTGITSEEIVLMCWGPGQNGKTVLIEVLRAMMGEYAAITEGATFIQSKYADASRPRNDIARLAGVRMVSASENSSDTHLDEVMIKKLTSCEDRISARFLNKEFFEFKPKFKIW